MGDDSYVLHQWTTDAADGIVESAGQGMDAINVLGADIDLTRSNLAAIENVTFTSDWEGRARTVMGNGRDNVILPHDANDPVEGRLGNDWLRGGSGNDTIHGWTGNDRLYSNVGADVLTVGAGSDRFIFARLPDAP